MNCTSAILAIIIRRKQMVLSPSVMREAAWLKQNCLNSPLKAAFRFSWR